MSRARRRRIAQRTEVKALTRYWRNFDRLVRACTPIDTPFKRRPEWAKHDDGHRGYRFHQTFPTGLR